MKENEIERLNNIINEAINYIDDNLLTITKMRQLIY